MNQDLRARFAALHVPGDPVLLYNIWDVGSAKAVAAGGAKALATGSHSLAEAQGYPDGEGIPFNRFLDTIRHIAAAVAIPVSADFEGGFAVDPAHLAEHARLLADAGAVGCNFEDQVIGGEGVHPLALQCRRIEAIRRAVGDAFFINARTDLFLKVKEHDGELVDEVIERGRAFADAGASGFFVPRLSNPRQAEKVVKSVPLPLNLIAFPGAPPKAEWASAGVARISHGPFPHRALMAKLEEMARTAIA
jgi:2-methylisocitrate lyase-like PEP mutase family enzyme